MTSEVIEGHIKSSLNFKIKKKTLFIFLVYQNIVKTHIFDQMKNVLEGHIRPLLSFYAKILLAHSFMNQF